MYHAIIVGARVAGSPLAMLLAREGYNVLLVDQASFPSDTVSTHLVWHSGLGLLKDWGLLERAQSLGAPTITNIQLELGHVRLKGPALPTANGVAEARAPRRMVLDKMLLDAAIEAGAEFRERFTVEGLIWDGDRVVGIRGRDSNGKPVEERAHIVIGADGRASRVARWVEAPFIEETKPCVRSYYSYFSGVELDGFEEFGGPDFGMGAVPTNDDLVCVVAGWTNDFQSRYGKKLEDAYWAAIGHNKSLYDRLRMGRREEPFRYMGEAPGFIRWSHGPGWALAGDAAYYRHPITAQGISDAFRDAERLAWALDDAFTLEASLEDALARAQRDRIEAVRPALELATSRATFEEPPPFLMPLLEAIQDMPEERAQFFGTDAGTYPIQRFFAPDNVTRILFKADLRSAA